MVRSLNAISFGQPLNLSTSVMESSGCTPQMTSAHLESGSRLLLLPTLAPSPLDRSSILYLLAFRGYVVYSCLLVLRFSSGYRL
jgi:hypothetical protein